MRKFLPLAMILTLVFTMLLFGTPAGAAEKETTLYNLTSVCRPDDKTVQLRITNDSDQDENYTLSWKGGSEKFEGIVKAHGKAVQNVPWTSANDTWILDIAGQQVTTEVGDKPKCDPEVPAPALTVTGDGKGNVFASITNAKEAKGTWTYLIEDYPPIVHMGVEGLKDEANFEHYLSPMIPSGMYKVTVIFEGVADGKAVKLTRTISLKVEVQPHQYKMAYQYKFEDCKHKIVGQVLGAKEISTWWEIEILKQDGTRAAYKDQMGSRSTLFSAEFDVLPAGTYTVSVALVPDSTYIDGKPGFAAATFPLEVTEEQVKACKSSTPQPPSSGNQNIGGRLPDTSTAYPVAAATGVAVLLAGVTLLVVRRFS
ncbi:hypothetical protein ACFO25_15010 [Paenactinomyces guangxiensis]|uniref:Uncharacterized protein n=1 Tax=Paenactinomyces guangxiensis TaxID=1490290 RepID=A0A7W1WPV4_9BACL|nr:hypothetical protein [Paenactinomyces guangxiensis]MBA4493830.1 hypothetical protein [Paenactinomyces guangxiensis]MBH8591296.1 hypothetical protein [Paenactinomyces guangxiensis]